MTGAPVHPVTRLLRPDLRGRSPYGAPQLDVAVRLNTNENSYPVPSEVAAAITAAVADLATGLNRYPDREAVRLRQDLARWLTEHTGVPVTTAQVWAANGSNEVLAQLVQAFAGPGRVALGFTPGYSMHPIISRTMGTTWVDGHRGSVTGPFDLSAASVLAQIREARPDVVFLCSPNNPTGTALPLSVVEAVCREPGERLVVVDEAYAEFARAGTRSAVTLLADHPTLVVTRTMSKAFALAGGRVGYLAAAPEVLDALRLVRLPYHLSSPTQAIARAALARREELLAEVAALVRQRDRLVVDLDRLGYPPVPSDANFVLFGGLADAPTTWQALLDRGVLIRDVGVSHHLRVTAGTEAETSAFLAALASLDDSHRLPAPPAAPDATAGAPSTSPQIRSSEGAVR